MKYRLLALITTGLCMTGALASLPAQAESNDLSATFPALQGIELTPSQQQKLTTLSNKTLAEVRSVLSPEQRAQFDSSLASGVGLKKSLLSVNLSMSQKLKLRNLIAPRQQQLEAILTPVQRQQAKANLNAQR
jgi:Spy/CpxP family protein refolding chaperone